MNRRLWRKTGLQFLIVLGIMLAFLNGVSMDAVVTALLTLLFIVLAVRVKRGGEKE